MSELTPALLGELRSSRPFLFGWVKIVFPNYTLRLLDGAGQVTMNGETYLGRDPAYGVLDSIKGLEDKIDGKAPEVTLGLIPSSDASLNSYIDPAVQGCPITIGIGALNMQTGVPVDSGYTLFTGYLDVPTIKWGDRDRRLDYVCTSIGERLFNIEEGRRLSDSFHKKVWPGEAGLQFVTEIETNVYWGLATPASGITSSTTSFAGSPYRPGDARVDLD